MLKTNNYNLCQWDAADPIRREDFNADNAAIDAAIAGLIVMGTYTGNAATLEDTQTITLGFQPRFLFVRDTSYRGSSSNGNNWTPQQLGFATPEHGTIVNGSYQVLSITEDGFIAGGFNWVFNTNGTVYSYLAIR